MTSCEPTRKTSYWDPPSASIVNAHIWLTRTMISVLLAQSRYKSITWMNHDCWLTSAFLSSPSYLPPLSYYGVLLFHLPRWVLGRTVDWDRRLVFYQMETYPQSCTFRSLYWAWLCPWKDSPISRRSWHKNLPCIWWLFGITYVHYSLSTTGASSFRRCHFWPSSCWQILLWAMNSRMKWRERSLG